MLSDSCPRGSAYKSDHRQRGTKSLWLTATRSRRAAAAGLRRRMTKRRRRPEARQHRRIWRGQVDLLTRAERACFCVRERTDARGAVSVDWRA